MEAAGFHGWRKNLEHHIRQTIEADYPCAGVSKLALDLKEWENSVDEPPHVELTVGCDTDKKAVELLIGAIRLAAKDMTGTRIHWKMVPEICQSGPDYYRAHARFRLVDAEDRI